MIQNETSYICPVCGKNEYNPQFKMCYNCSQDMNANLDEWIEHTQITTGMKEDTPF